MSTIAKVWNGTQGDFVLRAPGLLQGLDLQSAVINCLFTDAQAQPGDVIPDGTANRRGWWADPSFGSRLWLLDRAKKTQNTLVEARGYVLEALQVLIDAGAAAGFDVTCEWVNDGQLHVSVVGKRVDGATTAMRFAWAWNPEPTEPPARALAAVTPRVLDGTWALDGSVFLGGL